MPQWMPVFFGFIIRHFLLLLSGWLLAKAAVTQSWHWADADAVHGIARDAIPLIAGGVSLPLATFVWAQWSRRRAVRLAAERGAERARAPRTVWTSAQRAQYRLDRLRA